MDGAAAMTSEGFEQTIIGEAVIDACNQLAEYMNNKIPDLPQAAREIEARVASVTGSTLTLAAGLNEAVEVQDQFEVIRIVKEVKDPVTGEVLDNEVQPLGTLTVTHVRERIATVILRCSYPRQGDHGRKDPRAARRMKDLRPGRPVIHRRLLCAHTQPRW